MAAKKQTFHIDTKGEIYRNDSKFNQFVHEIRVCTRANKV